MRNGYRVYTGAIGTQKFKNYRDLHIIHKKIVSPLDNFKTGIGNK